MDHLQKNILFFDNIARYYDNILGRWFNGILRRLIKEVKIKDNSIILDAGCGTGSFLKIISKNKTLRLYGIDISPKMLEVAKSKLKNKAELNLIPAEKMSYKNKFDYIFSTEAFHHYSNQEKAVKNFNLALKKGGKLIIVDLNFGIILNWIFHMIEPGNRKMNSKEDFYKLFERYRFKNVQQKRLGLFMIMNVGEKTKPKGLNT